MTDTLAHIINKAIRGKEFVDNEGEVYTARFIENNPLPSTAHPANMTTGALYIRYEHEEKDRIVNLFEYFKNISK